MNVFVQDESTNLFGTHKDRRSAYIVEKAFEEGVSTLCLITSGNAGYSLANHARPNGIEVVSIVDTKLKENVKEKLRSVCRVVEIDLADRVYKPEEVIALARTNDDEHIWDVTNGFAAAYKSIIDDLSNREYTHLVCPVGSGELYVGLAQGLAEQGSKVQLIGVGVKTHPSFADKLSTPWTPYQEKMKEIEGRGNPIIRLSEEEVHAVYDIYKDKHTCEPSSAVAWAALEKAGIPADASVVIINSGKGVF